VEKRSLPEGTKKRGRLGDGAKRAKDVLEEQGKGVPGGKESDNNGKLRGRLGGESKLMVQGQPGASPKKGVLKHIGPF